MSSTRVRCIIAGVLVILAGVCYSSWVLAFFWASPLDPLRSFLSELDAENRPHRIWYEAGDIITSCCAILAALVMLIGRPRLPRSGTAVIAVVALGLFGASTIADALAPIECIPGVDKGCPYEPSGLLPQLHHVHALTSTLAVFSIFTAMIAATVTAFRSGQWPWLRVAGTTVLVIVVVSTVWMLVADNLSGDYVLGLAQRIQVGGLTVWLALWGASIIRDAPSPTAPPPAAR